MELPRPGGLEVGLSSSGQGGRFLPLFAGFGWISIQEKGSYNTRIKIEDIRNFRSTLISDQHCPLSLRTAHYHVVSLPVSLQASFPLGTQPNLRQYTNASSRPLGCVSAAQCRSERSNTLLLLAPEDN